MRENSLKTTNLRTLRLVLCRIWQTRSGTTKIYINQAINELIKNLVFKCQEQLIIQKDESLEYIFRNI